MDLERVLYKKMTKDELIDKLIAYKNIECHDRAIAHEFLCMQKEDPSRMNFVTHRLTDIADPKRVAEEIRRVKAERTASAQQPIKDELTDTIPVYVTLYKNIRFKKRWKDNRDSVSGPSYYWRWTICEPAGRVWKGTIWIKIFKRSDIIMWTIMWTENSQDRWDRLETKEEVMQLLDSLDKNSGVSKGDVWIFPPQADDLALTGNDF